MSNRVWRVVEGEALVVDLEVGDYYSLNTAGTLILRELAKGSKREQIVAKMAQTFDKPVPEMEIAFSNFHQQLVEEQLDGLDPSEDDDQRFLDEKLVYCEPVIRKYNQLDSLAVYSPDEL